MKELSSLDLYYLVKEFQVLVSGRLEKIWNKEGSFFLQVYTPSYGTSLLRILLPSLIYLTKEKNIKESDKFGLSLRKHISDSWIKSISQEGFERIMLIKLESNGKKIDIVVELFKPGNLIVCQDNKIIMAYSYRGFGSRLIRPGIEYKHPKKDINPLTMDMVDFSRVIENSKKSSIVVSLAVDFGFGGKYSEEICYNAGVEKNKQVLDDNEKRRLFHAIKELFNKEIEPHVSEDGFVSPFKLKTLNQEKIEASFSQAIEKYLTIKEIPEIEREKEKLIRLLDEQEKQLKYYENYAEENKKKGEKIYENYQHLSQLLKNKKNMKMDVELP